jgi:hypothetical protein
MVFVDPRRPTGLGESLSGGRAFYINVERHDQWPVVETHAAFRDLDPDDQEIVRARFTTALDRYLFLFKMR